MAPALTLRPHQRFSFPSSPVEGWAHLRFGEDVRERRSKGAVPLSVKRPTFDPTALTPWTSVLYRQGRWFIVEWDEEGAGWSVHVAPTLKVHALVFLGWSDCREGAMQLAETWNGREKHVLTVQREIARTYGHGVIWQQTKSEDWICLAKLPFRTGEFHNGLQFAFGHNLDQLGVMGAWNDHEGNWRWWHKATARLRWRPSETTDAGYSPERMSKPRCSLGYRTEEFAQRLAKNPDFGAFWGDGEPWGDLIRKAAEQWDLSDAAPEQATVAASIKRPETGLDHIDW